MKRKLISLAAAAAALILELIPYSVMMRFANPEGDPFISYCSYFDLTPYGYAVFPPLITAVLTCALLLVGILSILLKKDWRKGMRILAAAAAVISACIFLYGIPGAATLFSVFITAALAAAAVFA